MCHGLIALWPCTTLFIKAKARMFFHAMSPLRALTSKQKNKPITC